jgi:transcriptional regulator with XRE-family HTH domain
VTLTLETTAPVKRGALAAQVGARIRRFRKLRDMNLRDLADLCRTTPQTIQRLETDNMTLSVDWIEMICAALDIEPYLLFADDAIARASDEAIQARLQLVTLRNAFENFCNIVKASCHEQPR